MSKEAGTAVSECAMPCPYTDSAVYTVTMHDGTNLTGRFFESPIESPYWTMEVDPTTTQLDAENAAEWLAVNPAFIVAIRAASGDAYSRYVEAMGDQS